MVSNKTEIKFLEKKIAKNPDSPLFARLADLHLEQGDVDKAIEICEEGLQEHPYYVTGHIVLSKCYAALGMTDQAKSELKRILLFDPQCISATKTMGDMMKEEGWENLYHESYRRLAMLDPLEESVMQIVEEFGPELKSPEKIEPSADAITAAEALPLEQSSTPEAEFGETATDEVIEEVVEPAVNEEAPPESIQTVELGIETKTEKTLPEETVSSEEALETSAESGKADLFAIPLPDGKSYEEEPITFAQPDAHQIVPEVNLPSTEQVAEAGQFSQEEPTVVSGHEMLEVGLPAAGEEIFKTEEMEETIPSKMMNIEGETETEGITQGVPEELGIETTPLIEDKSATDDKGQESGAATESWGSWETLEKEPAETDASQIEHHEMDKSILETVPESDNALPEIPEASELSFEEGVKEEKFIEVSESLEDMQGQISPEKTKELDWILNEGEETPRIVEEDADSAGIPILEKELGKEAELETLPMEDLGKEEPIPKFDATSSFTEEEVELPSGETESDEIEEILPEIGLVDLLPLDKKSPSMEDDVSLKKEDVEEELSVLEEQDEISSKELLLSKDILGDETGEQDSLKADELLLNMPEGEFFETMEKSAELPEPPKGELLSLIDEVIGGKDEIESPALPDQSQKYEDLSELDVVDLKLEAPSQGDEIVDAGNPEESPSTAKEYDDRFQREDDLRTGIDRLLRTSGEETEEKKKEDIEGREKESLEPLDLDLRDLDEIMQESDRKGVRDTTVRSGMRKFDSRKATDSEEETERVPRDETEEEKEEFTLLSELPEKGETTDEEPDRELRESSELLTGKRELSQRTPRELKTGHRPEGKERTGIDDQTEIEDQESSELVLREKVDKSGSGLDELVTLTLGEIYLSKNQLDKAISVFKKLKEIYPDNKKIIKKLRSAQRSKRNAQKEQKSTDSSPDQEDSQEWRITGD